MKIGLTRSLAALLAMVLALPAPAANAGDAEIQTLRDELARLRESYDKSISALEKRLVQAEARAASAELIATRAETVAAPQPTPSGGANAFNPNISLILSGLYSNLSRNPAGYGSPDSIYPTAPWARSRPSAVSAWRKASWAFRPTSISCSTAR